MPSLDPLPDSGQDTVLGHFGFLPWELIHFSLPQRAVDGTVWTRQNGDRTLRITAGATQNPDGSALHVLPYGKYARAAILFLATQAKVTNNPAVEISSSYRGYLEQLGIRWSHDSALEAARQLRALAACSISISTQTVDENGEVHLQEVRFHFSKKTDIWFTAERDGLIDPTRPSTLVLSGDLFASVLERGIPVNLTAWRRLANETKSPMALDIYTWLSCRLHGVTGLTRISWEQLHEQFGSTTEMRDFRRKFAQALELAKTVYPEANATIVRRMGGRGFSGLLLQPSQNALESHLG